MKLNEPDSHFRGNDEVEVTRNPKQAKPNGLDSRLRGNDEILGF
ncbi:pilus assembly protein PilS, partial [Neisseria meningitidis]